MDDSMKDGPDIFIRTASSPGPVLFTTVLRDKVDLAVTGVATRTVFHTIHTQDNESHTLLLWVTLAPGPSLLSFEDARQRASKFLCDGHGNSPCVLLLRSDELGWDEDKSGAKSILMLLSKVEDAELQGALLSGEDQLSLVAKSIRESQKSNSRHIGDIWSRIRLRLHWPAWHEYETLSSTAIPESRTPSWRRYIFICASIIIAAIVIFASILLLTRSRSDGIYDRYVTTGSDGPRHQLRIYWQNASEWAAANPQDSGKWKVRIDDQAIIPAELYDEDEEHYQQWYRNRYPEMQQVIDNRDYIRPSWMGSLNMVVPWDNQFHFAHCVLALRRYWKAKETGRHVCGRDIDYLHIQHCLSSLEERAFIDGPRQIEDPPTVMYWQTRVCF